MKSDKVVTITDAVGNKIIVEDGVIATFLPAGMTAGTQDALYRVDIKDVLLSAMSNEDDS